MPRLVTAALWLVFTAVAVLTGLGAVAIVQGAVTGKGVAPLSAEQVSRQLRSATTAPPTAAPPTSTPPTATPPTRSATPTATPPTATPPTRSTTPTRPSTAVPTATVRPTATSAPPAAVVRTIGSRGGTVVAACTSGRVYLRSWSPAAGFVVDSYDRGPGREASITFASAEAGRSETEVGLKVTCLRGIPVAEADVGGESD